MEIYHDHKAKIVPSSKTATVNSNACRLAVEYYELEEVYVTFLK